MKPFGGTQLELERLLSAYGNACACTSNAHGHTARSASGGPLCSEQLSVGRYLVDWEAKPTNTSHDDPVYAYKPICRICCVRDEGPEAQARFDKASGQWVAEKRRGTT